MDPGATCGAPLSLTLAITSTEGASTTVPVTVVLGSGPATARDSTDVPKAIPDNNAAGTTSTLAVADPGTIQDANVRIGNLTHTWVGDLKLELTSPAGTIVVLANRPGGTANSANNFTGTVFDDEASVAIGAGGTAAPYTGSFKPQADQLSRFDGETQQGTWTLKVSDLAMADTGSLNAWGLDLAVGTCDFDPPPAPGQPTGLVATAGADSVALDWNDTAGATDYEIYRRGPGGALSHKPNRDGHVERLRRPRPNPGAGVLLQGRRAERREPRPAVGGALRHSAAPGRAARPSRRIPVRDPHAGSVGTAALDPCQPAGHLRAQVPRHARPGRLTQDHDRQGRGGRAQAETGGGPEAVHGSRQRARPS